LLAQERFFLLSSFLQLRSEMKNSKNDFYSFDLDLSLFWLSIYFYL